jgi:hypothetical protein
MAIDGVGKVGVTVSLVWKLGLPKGKGIRVQKMRCLSYTTSKKKNGKVALWFESCVRKTN